MSDYEKLAETLEGLAKDLQEARDNIASLTNETDGDISRAVYLKTVLQQRFDYVISDNLPAITAALRECAKRRPEPDDERVERVARAMAEAFPLSWKVATEAQKDYLREVGLAAIRAMED